jgi:hypothetical protein
LIIARQARDKEQDVERNQQKAVREAKRVCALIAKMVREFWMQVDRVVDYRAQEIIEAKKREALDQHLDFIVSEADKLSNLVQEGLTTAVTTQSRSITPAASSSRLDDGKDDNGKRFVSI